jgi:SAM-dependent methyltransferase
MQLAQRVAMGLQVTCALAGPGRSAISGERLQTSDELDTFYRVADPWGYFSHADDARRRDELLAILPRRDWGRVLDIGCGNGFITLTLPGREIVGVDFSTQAIRWAREEAAKQAHQGRFRFEVGSLLDPGLAKLGHFDLVVLTGVLYEQYV